MTKMENPQPGQDIVQWMAGRWRQIADSMQGYHKHGVVLVRSGYYLGMYDMLCLLGPLQRSPTMEADTDRVIDEVQRLQAESGDEVKRLTDAHADVFVLPPPSWTAAELPVGPADDRIERAWAAYAEKFLAGRTDAQVLNAKMEFFAGAAVTIDCVMQSFQDSRIGDGMVVDGAEFKRRVSAVLDGVTQFVEQVRKGGP